MCSQSKNTIIIAIQAGQPIRGGGAQDGNRMGEGGKTRLHWEFSRKLSSASGIRQVNLSKKDNANGGP